MCREAAGAHPLVFRQSNAEHELIDWVHEAIDEGAGIIINPAGLSFRSIPLLDALKMFPGPIIELHISNIHRRDEIYQRSLISKAATAVIAGLGADGYPRRGPGHPRPPPALRPVSFSATRRALADYLRRRHHPSGGVAVELNRCSG